jgi:heptaprenyl diphosphate synthase
MEMFSSRGLFFAGIAMMPALLFNPSTAMRTVQLFLFLAFAWGMGRKFNFIAMAMVMGTIVLFNLIVPYGRVLARIGAFSITQGALMGGIEKAVTLEALIMLSRASIRTDLRLPGAFGEMIGSSFRLFETLLQRKATMDWKDPLGSVDRLMVDLSAEQGLPASGGAASGGTAPGGAASGRGRSSGGLILIAAAVCIAWVPLACARLWSLP